MGLFKRSLAGPGYIILNAIRVLNIISLLMVVTASVLMLVKTFMISKFFFFDALSHVITAFLGLFLILSEIGLFRGYFMRNWPLLSPNHGFITLGTLMIVVGVSILGNLNKEATSENSLGKSFWQIVISSGILVSILGTANIIASFVFRTKKLNVTARMVRAYGATAPQKAADTLAIIPPINTSHPSSSYYSPSVHSNSSRFGALPRDGLPSYHAPAMSSSNSARLGGFNISGPVNHDPEQFAKFKGSEDIARPDPTAHPALNGGRF